MNNRTIFSFYFWLLSTILSFAQSAEPSIQITDQLNNEEVLVDCSYPLDADRCFELKATFTEIKETTSYEVTAIPYANPILGIAGGTQILIETDDRWQDTPQVLPFTFCFYNTSFTKFITGDNGLLSFKTDVASGAQTMASFKLPDSRFGDNIIFGALHDMVVQQGQNGCVNKDDPLTPLNECGEIMYYTTGVAPGRKAIISFENMSHFDCFDSKSTFQIVLYETSNIIDIYIEKKPENCEVIRAGEDNTSIINRKNALVGIQKDGTEAVAAPNRNNEIWETTNEAWRFIPNGAALTELVWKDASDRIIQRGGSLKVCPEMTTEYKAEVTYNLCLGGTELLDDVIPIVIDTEFPVATAIEKIICDPPVFNEETVDITIYENEVSVGQTGLTYSYYRNEVDAKAAFNAIDTPENLKLETKVTEVYVRLQRGISCFDVGKIKLTLESTGKSAISKISLCDVANDDEEDIALTDFTNAIRGGQSSLLNISYHKSFNDADNNLDPILLFTEAKDGDPIFIRFTIGPDEICKTIEEISIELKPEPVVMDIPVEVCDDVKIYDLTTKEAEITSLNPLLNLNFTYFESTRGRRPIKEEDIKQYVLNRRATVYVRTIDPSQNCLKEYELNFTYKKGIPATDDTQAQINDPSFNLTESIANMIADDTNINVRYFDCDTDVAIVDPVNYTLTGNEGMVCVEFENTISGCKSNAEINLENARGGASGGGGGGGGCDQDNDGTETIILDEYSDQIIEDTVFDFKKYLQISYFRTEAEANSDTAEITEITIIATTTVFVRRRVIFKGKEIDFDVFPFEIEFKPTTQYKDQKIGICDVRNDGFERYDLTQLETDILNGIPGTITRYEDESENEITSPERYFFRGPSKEVFAIVVSPNGCENKTKIEISFDDPIPSNNIIYSLCDFNNDREEVFDLDSQLPDINSDYTSFTVTYYNTQNGADNELAIDQITSPFTYRGSSRFVYVRLEGAEDCFTTAQIRLTVERTPVIQSTEITICDFDNNAIELEQTVSDFNPEIIGTQRGVEVVYYASEKDAEDEINPITEFDITPTTELYVSVKFNRSECIQRFPITFNFEETPNYKDVEITVCDNLEVGTEPFDLTSLTTEITTETSSIITYHTSIDDANANLRAITKPSDYSMDTSTPFSLYARVNSATNSCYSVAKMSFDFVLPAVISETTLNVCGSNNVGVFDLTEAIPKMTTSPGDFDISFYFKDIQNAINEDAAFLVSEAEKYDSNLSDLVFARFNSKASSCFMVKKITLLVRDKPKLVRSDFDLCDSDFDGDFTLSLNDLNAFTSAQSDEFTYTYFTSFDNAENDTNPILGIANFKVTEPVTTIYLKALNKAGCTDISFVNIIIDEQVQVNTVAEVLESCDEDRDGVAMFDLTTFENRLTDEVSPTFDYYLTKEEADNEENKITNTTNWLNINETGQTLFVRVSVSGKCDNITSFNLKPISVNAAPKNVTFCAGDKAILDAGLGFKSYLWNTGETTATIEITTPGMYTVEITDAKDCANTFEIEATELALPTVIPKEVTACDEDGTLDGFFEFNLSDYVNELKADALESEVSFYTSEADALSKRDNLALEFINTVNPQTLYVRVENTLTKCFNTTTLKLTVSVLDSAAAALKVCDEQGSEDGLSEFTLSNADATVLNGQSFSVSYYKTATDAERETNVLADKYRNETAYNQTIYSRIENANECVSIKEVDLIVEKLPNIKDEEEVLYCIHSFPDTIELVSDIPESEQTDYTYLWNTGETSASINVNTAGIYTVEVINMADCSKTKTITVKEIEIAIDKNVTDMLCDDTDNSSDGFLSIQLSNYIDQITLNNDNLKVEFFESLEALNTGRTLNVDRYKNTSNPQTIITKVTDKLTNCSDQGRITLTISTLNINNALLELCDEVDAEDGLHTFDLTLADEQVLSGKSYAVTYYESFDNAEKDTNPLNTIYDNIQAYDQALVAKVINENGCVAYSVVSLSVNELPAIETKATRIYCLDTFPNTISLNSDTDGRESEFTYLWNTGATTATLDINQVGEYNVIVKDRKACERQRFITVISSEKPTIDKIDIEDGETVNTVSVFASGSGTYQYAIDGGGFQESNVFTEIDGGLHEITVSDTSICGSVSQTIAVVSFPKSFTPNGDGINETWFPQGFSSQYQEMQDVSIFDRYGKLLSKLDLNSGGWDGTHNGAHMPTDAYWYLVTYKELFSGKTRQAKGYFELKR
ncbi:T9SS type B sorting domain-containing protein [Aquimarina agarilytica]|uniref:T9SS type B sorting domain-containing protein n=1 Tax=Aquimarina agarilytica TaxID=1087449 RepID=UPI0012F9FD71|nr:T9SS type B sorting domain-containing protein [Aquimarina agarilytica]